MDTLIKNGSALVWKRNSFSPEKKDILIHDNKIIKIADEIPVPQADDLKIIEATDKLIVPGMVNSHLHSNENMWRGMWDNEPDEIWSVDCYPVTGYERLDERFIYLRTMIGIIEMLKSGTTWARDEVFEIPSPSIDSIDAIMKAYQDSGMRADLSLTMIDTPPWVGLPWMDELMPPDIRKFYESNPLPGEDFFIDICAASIEKWNNIENRLRFTLAPHSPQRCTKSFLLRTNELSQKYNLPYNIHVLETITQLVQAQDIYRKYGGKTLAYMKELGILSPRTSIAHAIWIDDDEIEIMKDAGVSIAHNIVSNLKLGSGIMPFYKVKKAGINICLGTDGMSGAAETQNLYEVMKFAALVHKATNPYFEEWPTCDEVFYCATQGGARAGLMGNQLGLVEEGYRADLSLMNLKTVTFTPFHNACNQLVYSENGSSVETVLVDGKVVLANGKLTCINEDEIMAEFNDRIPAWRKKYEKNTIAFRKSWQPVVTKMHYRAAHTPIKVNRFITPQDSWK